MIAKIIACLAIFMAATSASTSTFSDEINYCDDPKVNQEWARLMLNYGDNPEWKDIYRYRKQLCKQVKAGRLTLDRAIILFDQLRGEKIRQLQRRLEKTRGYKDLMHG